MIIIALGANLNSRYGSPEDTIERAKDALKSSGVAIRQSSRTWMTAPVPASDQPWYRNAVISVDTGLRPRALMALLLDIESSFGRIRGERNAPRVIDLDLIAYYDVIIEEEGLQIPHPRMEDRAFVLVPMQEILPNWRHPVLDLSVSDMVGNLTDLGEMKPLQSRVA